MNRRKRKREFIETQTTTRALVVLRLNRIVRTNRSKPVWYFASIPSVVRSTIGYIREHRTAEHLVTDVAVFVFSLPSYGDIYDENDRKYRVLGGDCRSSYDNIVKNFRENFSPGADEHESEQWTGDTQAWMFYESDDVR